MSKTLKKLTLPELMELYQAGILTKNEARFRLGLDVLSENDTTYFSTGRIHYMSAGEPITASGTQGCRFYDLPLLISKLYTGSEPNGHRGVLGLTLCDSLSHHLNLWASSAGAFRIVVGKTISDAKPWFVRLESQLCFGSEFHFDKEAEAKMFGRAMAGELGFVAPLCKDDPDDELIMSVWVKPSDTEDTAESDAVASHADSHYAIGKLLAQTALSDEVDGISYSVSSLPCVNHMVSLHCRKGVPNIEVPFTHDAVKFCEALASILDLKQVANTAWAKK